MLVGPDPQALGASAGSWSNLPFASWLLEGSRHLLVRPAATLSLSSSQEENQTVDWAPQGLLEDLSVADLLRKLEPLSEELLVFQAQTPQAARPRPGVVLPASMDNHT